MSVMKQLRHWSGARPTIGVLITSYNYGAFVPDCIHSVLNQEAPFDEIVVVDDGSTDGSVELLRSYSPRVSVISKPNGGQLSALVAGIEAMDSEYVYTLDIDDYVAPRFVREIRPYLENRPAKIQFQLIGVDVNRNRLGSVFPTYPKNYGAFEMIEDNRVIGFYQCPPTSGNIFRRDVLKEMRLERMNLRDAIDGQPTLAIPYLGPVTSINQPLAYYRAHGNSDSRWDRPDSSLLQKEIDRFHKRWADVCHLLGLEKPPFGSDRPLYVLERNLMRSVFESKEPLARNAFDYVRRLLTARIPVRQKAVLAVWALAFLLPVARWRRHLVLARRSPLNRSAGLQKVIGALTQISGDLTPDSGSAAATPMVQER